MLDRNEADAQLRQAIEDHAEAYGLRVEGEMLNQFAIIVHWQKVEDEGRSNYTTHFHTPSIPNHIAVGLFQTGTKIALDEGYD